MKTKDFINNNPQLQPVFDTYIDAIMYGTTIDQHDDVIAFHSVQEPVNWEVGAYGIRPGDCHDGPRGFFEFLRETVAGPWLDPEALRARFARPCQ